MTIDKIRHYMNPVIFDHWANCQDVEVIKTAAKDLEQELNSGILQGVAYQAELQFLRMKLS